VKVLVSNYRRTIRNQSALDYARESLLTHRRQPGGTQ
jgi:hypothetical protein